MCVDKWIAEFNKKGAKRENLVKNNRSKSLITRHFFWLTV